MIIPQYQITRIIQSMGNKPGACPNLSLTGDTLFTTMAQMAHFFISVKIHNFEFRILNSEFWIQNSEFRIQNSELWIVTEMKKWAIWVIVLYWWRHSHLRNVMFKAIKLISCDIQRKSISILEKIYVFHMFMREYSVDIFCEKWLWPLGYLLYHKIGIGASKLK